MLPKKETKTIKLKNYTKEVKLANRFLPNKYDVMFFADGFFMFKRWGKGKKMFQFTNVTVPFSAGALKTEVRHGARLISILFDDKVTSYNLKGDIIKAMEDLYKSGYWNKGQYKDKYSLEPKDFENLSLRVTSRWW